MSFLAIGAGNKVLINFQEFWHLNNMSITTQPMELHLYSLSFVCTKISTEELSTYKEHARHDVMSLRE